MTTYKLEELAREADVSARTVRYYVQRGLLPPPDFRGAQTTYGPAHLLRLRLVKRLQQAHQPLEVIASRLAGATVEELERMLANPPPDEALALAAEVASAPAGLGGPYRSAPTPAREAHRETWERVELLPGVELHVRGDASALARRVAREIQTFYGPFSSKSTEE